MEMVVGMDMGRVMGQAGMGIPVGWAWIVHCRRGRRDIDRRVWILLRRLVQVIRRLLQCENCHRSFAQGRYQRSYDVSTTRMGHMRSDETNERKSTQKRNGRSFAFTSSTSLGSI